MHSVTMTILARLAKAEAEVAQHGNDFAEVRAALAADAALSGAAVVGALALRLAELEHEVGYGPGSQPATVEPPAPPVNPAPPAEPPVIP